MRLFTLDKDYNVLWEPQVALLAPFAKILARDKTKDKTKANKELAFVYFYIDIKSDYNIHSNLKEKTDAIKGDLKLAKTWKVDKVMQDAIEYYAEMSSSITANMLRRSRYIADKLSEKMREAVDDDDLSIDEMGKLLASINKMPDVIDSLQRSEKAVLKEIEEQQDKLGTKQKALFEDGL